MPVRIGDATPSGFRFGDLTATKIYLGDILVFPAFTVVSQTFSTVGNWTFNIPAECGAIDIILLGGGGGGSSGNGAIGTGSGGEGGHWQAVTLIRGIDIPFTATQITGVVADGGTGGPGGWIPINGNPGGNTTANVAGLALVGEGGQGGGFFSGDRAGYAPVPQVLNYNGINYTGGAATGNSAANGNAPGGGAGGGNSGFFGFPAGGGGKGARGQAWVRAYV
ncbi:hypothetical protein ARTURO_4 [Mycobacterium phage Arturo]|uniref:Glycine-rich domain-containing protein n=1 Tax=Mycobacterium phage Arturo TaxID=2902839 RepID=K0G9R6_9CAUD|nr:minor tail protein [Mycobacterium phage Arturo]AFU20459.1 hypothetical protein ARTURO_4 [Mycobacterium phage Arturo]